MDEERFVNAMTKKAVSPLTYDTLARDGDGPYTLRG